VNTPIDIKNRKPIWIALSELYLDVELQDSDFNLIAKRILESPYGLKEVKQINKAEVFPVLYKNLLSVAGEWTGFDEQWLVESIQGSLRRRNFVKAFVYKAVYTSMKGMFKEEWARIEKQMKRQQII